MCEFRVHWADNGVIHYRWHGTIKKARQDVRGLRRQLCRNAIELNSHDNIVRFNLVNGTLLAFTEFVYEHAEGHDPGKLHKMRKPELLEWLNANVIEGPTIGRRRRAA